MNRPTTSLPTISTKRLLALTGTGWMFDAMDVGLLSFILVAIKQEWHLDAQTLGWIGSINSIGMAIGAFAFGLLADRWGRARTLVLTILLFSLASGLSALATGVIMFAVLRFFIGLGLGGELPVASTLVSESVSAEKRGQVVVLLESFWAWGWLIAALLAWSVIPAYEYGWRIALLLCALPALFAAFLRRHLRDATIYRTKHERKSLLTALGMLWQRDQRQSTFMIWMLWFCVVFAYYGMFLWLPSILHARGYDVVHSFGYVVIMTLAQLPGYFSVAWLIERVGRRRVLVIYLLGTALAACAFGYAQTVPMILISGCFLSFFNLGAWGAMYAYTPELYPTAIRATGAGSAATLGRIGGIFGPLVPGLMLGFGASTGTIFLVFCAALVLASMMVLWLGPETRGQALRE